MKNLVRISRAIIILDKHKNEILRLVADNKLIAYVRNPDTKEYLPIEGSCIDEMLNQKERKLFSPNWWFRGKIVLGEAFTVDALRFLKWDLKSFANKNSFQYNDDFTDLKWRGQNFTLNHQQGLVIKLLYERYKAKKHITTSADIFFSAQLKYSQMSLQKLFRDQNGKKIWGTLLIRVSSGKFKLDLP